MKRKFEEFTGRFVPARGPRVGLQSRGGFSLNKAAYELLDKPTHVVLLYDRETNAVGMRPAAEDVPHAYPVRKQKGADSYIITGKSFCDHYSIPYGQSTQHFTPTLEDGTLVIEPGDD
jgi:hypothetical protein